MTTNQPTPVILNDEALAEIESLVSTRADGLLLVSAQRDALCQTVRALREQLTTTEELKRGYYDEAAKGWEKFREAERENTALREQLARAIHERDLAVAHDRQPYPTAEAYEKVCAALNEHKERLAQVEKERTRLETLLEDFGTIYGKPLSHDQADALWANAATRMRERCVEKVGQLRDEWDAEANAAFARRDLSAEVRLRTKRDAARAVITELEYVTLEGKQKQ